MVKVGGATLRSTGGAIDTHSLEIIPTGGITFPGYRLERKIFQIFTRLQRNTCMVWGAMYTLAAITSLKADDLYQPISAIQKAMERGLVVTIDNGVKAQALIAVNRPEYQREIVPYLLNPLQKCRSKEVPLHSECACTAISDDFILPYRQVLTGRMVEMTPP